ncbi:Y-family DNA polymerase [Nitrogeniibacter aestuarii]|uniref:Y-family DNA polymerase n=1 Tax=Nitrogeniibacter aestuarii TaxID=2815343 RepID=UPI001E53E4C9|nr:DNA polymerase Y family protein [Nitrogeniibacter aestuarii]
MEPLWLAIHFHRLPVEVLALPAPAAVIARQRIVVADTLAAQGGIKADMRLADALALVPGLRPHERQPELEADALSALACWAGNFTPMVSLEGTDTLLLEIGGCLQYFGGTDIILGLVRQGAIDQGLSVRLGLAPTPRAAHWLSRVDHTDGCWESRLAELPVEALPLSQGAHERLHALGLHTLGKLYPLPSATLGHRFGAELPVLLGQARGQLPDPRKPFDFPEQFAQRLELPAKVEHAERLLFAARRLLLALAGWLEARQAGISECTLILAHEDLPPTRLVLGFATPTRNAERLLRVTREQLERHQLAAPAIELFLEANAPQALAGTNGRLFGQQDDGAIAPVVERLRARLGDDAVHGIRPLADHRPECATAPVRWPIEPDTGVPQRARPLWLEEPPRPLRERAGRPTHSGEPLSLLSRGERLESGWWDQGEAAGDMRRDYFVASTPEGAWLWVFRDPQGWWLHGYFD